MRERGFAMGLFSKKYCSVCGNEIKLLGNRKLEDGNLCKPCAKKLSPLFSERRHSTVDEIKEQLAYREANKADVAAFNVTRTLGTSLKVLVDEPAQRFLVTSERRWRDENPDVIRFSQVTGCSVDVHEDRTERTYEDSDGNERGYNPPRYDYRYDIYAKIHVNSPYFDEIVVKLNDVRVESQHSAEFESFMSQAQEIRDTLTGAREQAAAAAAPKTVQTCPHCGATCIPDANGRCEYCGGAMA